MSSVGAFWDPAEVRAVNKQRRRTSKFLREYADVIKALDRLEKAEADLEAAGVDPEELYRDYGLGRFDIVGGEEP